jgi:hypothetical protein
MLADSTRPKTALVQEIEEMQRVINKDILKADHLFEKTHQVRFSPLPTAAGG